MGGRLDAVRAFRHADDDCECFFRALAKCARTFGMPPLVVNEYQLLTASGHLYISRQFLENFVPKCVPREPAQFFLRLERDFTDYSTY